MAIDEFELVQVPGGRWTLRARAEGETYHPGVGPEAEAKAIYVEPLGLHVRRHPPGSDRALVIWDVGLGAAANAVGVLSALPPGTGRVVVCSFDRTLAPLSFAQAHTRQLGYLGEFEPHIGSLLAHQCVDFTHRGIRVDWTVTLGDFPTLLATAPAGRWPAPDAILWDPHSPRRNPDMWTLPLFRELRARLPGGHRCNLATYSRSTLLRVSLLEAGFFVGHGAGHDGKEETTVAATVPDLAGRLLDRSWLDRARRSTSAEPLPNAAYRQAPLSPTTRESLDRHPQFREVAGEERLYGSDKTFAPSGTDMA